ncbi:hypothetical protein TspCOW1_26590 [Thiohalobacter sp. COW1]|uniref:Serine/threonine protein phosphatase n=1 Tax=Thiohalobacter thiocyanaticus TaxID=585455 RepID=A0A1Z4VLI5_9GAMM|nr:MULTISPECIES: PP2C family serine/threonine-protein phosphatase [Thiohalobacter]BAZ92459.1 serine/threonine protein phosphatase [Thiohalobacter thiocyanaticus]BCO32556.1 hypothetical protein TspCOW1_26590 [Thiohalobacter sp. COW1]
MRFTSRQTSRIGNRSSNQDRSLVLADSDGVLLAVADGMGGHARGDLAAQAFVDSLARRFRQRDPLQDPAEFLTEALAAAHRTIIAVGQAQRPPIAPLTTGVVCLISGETAHWAHVGDSRLYLLRQDTVAFQTRDHTPLADMIDAGLLSERQARSHRLRNQVSRCLGDATVVPEPTLGPTAWLQPGDVLLLCSDGLWSPLEPSQLQTLTASENLADCLETLAVTAEARSYPHSDNVTAVALRWEGADSGSEPAPESGQRTGNGNDTGSLSSLDRAIAAIEQAMADYADEIPTDAPAQDRSQSV